jgi:hypothetical protein
MLNDRDGVMLELLDFLDSLDAEAFERFVERALPCRERPTDYPFLVRTETTTARTVASFVEHVFLASNPTATRH